MDKAREHWSSKLGFLFAALGSAVGLGVLWKFPYTVGQNGGGLFLLAYILCTLIIGIPVFIAELLIGRTSQSAAIRSFGTLEKEKHVWKVAGWLGVISSFLIMSFYSVIAGWGMSYILMSLSGVSSGKTAPEMVEIFHTLQRSGGVTTAWHALFTIITMFIVLSGVRDGIEKWSRIMTRALFVMLIILVIYCMSLPGFNQAWHFIFSPNASSFKPSSIIEALGLAFFTLSLGQGIMFSYGSYMKPDDNIPTMATVVATAVIVVSILGALTIFPVVFSFGFEPSAGTGLIFQTLPYLFAQLVGGQMLATIFFILFVFTAITSAVAFVEVCATNLMEMYGLRRNTAVYTICAATFLVGIPSAYAWVNGIFPDWRAVYGTNFLDTLDRLVSIWLIPIGGLVTALFVGWAWKSDSAQHAFSEGADGFAHLFKLWRFWMRWVIPALIFLIILQKSGLVDFDSAIRG